jgi:hypothetical protein
MPPWPADSSGLAFHADRRLDDEERRTLLDWVAAGAPEGTPQTPAPVPSTPGGWHIGKPDLVIPLPHPVTVPKDGSLDLQYFTATVAVPADAWVEAMEVMPERREVVHHATVFVLPPTGSADTPLGLRCREAEYGERALETELRMRQRGPASVRRRYLYSWTPGSTPFFAPKGSARLIAAGSTLVFEMHYEPNGRETQDQTRIGLRFAKHPPRDAISAEFTMQTELDIPPGDPNHEEKACFELMRDATLFALKPHMHLRGRDIRMVLERPGEAPQTLIFIPRWDFDWQIFYELEQPMVLRKGWRIRTIGHFDNSTANPRNPDPTREVVWDERTTGEMLAGTLMFSSPR